MEQNQFAMICVQQKVVMYCKPKGTWHTVVVNEPCVIFEAKYDACEPLSADYIVCFASLGKRTKLIDSLSSAVCIGNIPAIIDIKSTINIERYRKDVEVMELSRLALYHISD